MTSIGTMNLRLLRLHRGNHGVQVIRRTFGNRPLEFYQTWWQPQQNNIDGLVQDYGISIAKALEMLQSCTKPSMFNVCIFSRSYCNSHGTADGMWTVASWHTAINPYPQWDTMMMDSHRDTDLNQEVSWWHFAVTGDTGECGNGNIFSATSEWFINSPHRSVTNNNTAMLWFRQCVVMTTF